MQQQRRRRTPRGKRIRALAGKLDWALLLLALVVFSVGFSVAQQSRSKNRPTTLPEACSSDFSCPTGYKCINAVYSSTYTNKCACDDLMKGEFCQWASPSFLLVWFGLLIVYFLSAVQTVKLLMHKIRQKKSYASASVTTLIYMTMSLTFFSVATTAHLFKVSRAGNITLLGDHVYPLFNAVAWHGAILCCLNIPLFWKEVSRCKKSIMNLSTTKPLFTFVSLSYLGWAFLVGYTQQARSTLLSVILVAYMAGTGWSVFKSAKSFNIALQKVIPQGDDKRSFLISESFRTSTSYNVGQRVVPLDDDKRSAGTATNVSESVNKANGNLSNSRAPASRLGDDRSSFKMPPPRSIIGKLDSARREASQKSAQMKKTYASPPKRTPLLSAASELGERVSARASSSFWETPRGGGAGAGGPRPPPRFAPPPQSLRVVRLSQQAVLACLGVCAGVLLGGLLADAPGPGGAAAEAIARLALALWFRSIRLYLASVRPAAAAGAARPARARGGRRGPGGGGPGSPRPPAGLGRPPKASSSSHQARSLRYQAAEETTGLGRAGGRVFSGSPKGDGRSSLQRPTLYLKSMKEVQYESPGPDSSFSSIAGAADQTANLPPQNHRYANRRMASSSINQDSSSEQHSPGIFPAARGEATAPSGTLPLPRTAAGRRGDERRHHHFLSGAGRWRQEKKEHPEGAEEKKEKYLPV